jgi:Bacterial Ig domain
LAARFYPINSMLSFLPLVSWLALASVHLFPPADTRPLPMPSVLSHPLSGTVIDWNFDTNFDHWAYATQYRWYVSGGRNNTGFLQAFSVGGPTNFVASPGAYLFAGERYTFSCRTQASNPNIQFRASVNTQQTVGGSVFMTFTPVLNDRYATPISGTFTVPTDGIYYISLSFTGTGSYQQVDFDDWQLTGRSNQAPLSTVTTPGSDFVTAEQAPMLVSMTAADPDPNGSVTKVELLANSIKLGETSTTPYKLATTGLTPGQYQLRARATDNEGVSEYSFPRSMTVVANDLAASYLGGSGTDDVRGMVIQPDGTVVLATNLTASLQPGNVTPILLNGATAASMGAILRLSGDGRRVLSMTRLAAQVVDLAQDAQGNLYVAAGSEGMLKINPLADAVIWKQTPGQFTHRVDAGPTGYSVLMVADETNPDLGTLTGNIKMMAYDPAGTKLFQVGSVSQYMADVAIDEASQTVIGVGHKNFKTPSTTGASALPVYVPVVRAYTYAGTQKYVGYDWSSDQTSDRWLNKSNNNMADLRTSRCSIGLDGKLYITFEASGGNHALRYDPFDIMKPVTVVGGDIWFNFSNTNTEVKTLVGRFEPGTGAWLLGQGFVARINPPLNKGNTIFARNGNVTADATGRIYMTGQSAYGIPLTIDHLPGDYIGGAYVLILSADMTKRESVLRLTNGSGRAIAVRSPTNWGYAGSTSNPFYTGNALQASSGGGTDGFFAIKGTASALPVTYLDFRATYVNNRQVAVSWATSYERDNAFFAIERSLDAVTFSELGRITGRGIGSGRQDYGFSDETPGAGWNYYRLRQVDLDGTVAYSRPVAVLNESSLDKDLLLFPNPATTTLSLRLRNPVISARLLDVRGGRQPLPLHDNIAELSQLPAGLYLIEVETATGQVLRQRFVKQ